MVFAALFHGVVGLMYDILMFASFEAHESSSESKRGMRMLEASESWGITIQACWKPLVGRSMEQIKQELVEHLGMSKTKKDRTASSASHSEASQNLPPDRS